MSVILDPNGITIKWTGATVPAPYFVQANPRGLTSGNEWFAIVNNSTKSNITNYANNIQSGIDYFTPGVGQLPIPFNNIVTTLITDMSIMFLNLIAFDQDIGSWDTSNVTTMADMFNNASIFNRNIGSWNTSNVTNMYNLFYRAAKFNQPIGLWNTSKVTNMYSLFSRATVFNQNISLWNTSMVTNMGGTFYYSAFNGSISLWNTSNVTNMSAMFMGATAFDKPIGTWNTSNVIDMNSMFRDATTFNQDIGSWNTSKVINMSSMFYNAYKFNRNISTKISTKLDGSKYVAWNTSNVTNMSFMFYMSSSFTNALGDFNNGETPSNGTVAGNSPLYWDTSNVSNITYIFLRCRRFNQNVSTQYVTLVDGNFSHNFVSWNTANVTSLAVVFGYCECFNNGDLPGQSNRPLRWNTSKVTSMYFTFGQHNWFVLNQGILDSNNTVLEDKLMFAIGSYNQPMKPESVALGNGINYLAWDLSKNTNTAVCFQNQFSFNTDLSNWNTSIVINMVNMFYNNAIFNQNIGAWNTSKVTNMSTMFYGASAFNQDIGSWNTSNVTNMSYMFSYASAFNQLIGLWITSKVTDMSYMFYGASKFNQYIRSWNVKTLGIPVDFSKNCPLISSNSPNWGGEPVLCITTVDENVPIGTIIGFLSSDPTNPTTYTLISNPLGVFAIRGSYLITVALLNYTLYSSYTIELRITVGGTSVTKSFTISITDIPQAPTSIDVLNGTGKNIPEDSPVRTFLGDLYTIDPDRIDNFIYQFVNGFGSSDNQLFILENNKLYTNTLFNYKTKNNYSIRLKSTDATNISVEQILVFKVVIPYSSDTQITTLVGRDKSIQLTGNAVSGKSLLYQIVTLPIDGSFVSVPNSNGKYVYKSNKRGTDFFTYIIREGTMSSELIRVNINNYSQVDVESISRNQGTFTFDNISFDGDNWRFGTFTTDIFIQNGNHTRMGNFDFYNQNPV
jgi:surface protein